MHLLFSAIRTALFMSMMLMSTYGWRSYTQVTLIKAGKIIDPESGKILADQDILIEKSKITEIGKNLPLPKGAEIIDLREYILIPGLMDAHTHLGSNATKFAEYLGINYLEEILLNPDSYRGIRAAAYAREMLEAGFTTVREAGNSGNYVDVSLKRAINEGLIPGPNIYAAGRIIAPFGGQFGTRADKKYLDNPEYFFADTKDELRKAIRENIYYGADVIKIVVDGTKYQYDLEDLQFIVSETGKAGIKVMAHCQTPKGEYNAARAGVASIEHGWTIRDSTARIMKEKGVVLVSTDFTVKELVGIGWDTASAQAIHSRRVERLKRVYNQDVEVAFGTDIMTNIANETRGSLAIDYIQSFKEAGIPNPAILKIMTWNVAKLIGIEKERGLIRKGYYADIIAVKENPLDNIDALRKVSFVMKNGAVWKEPE